MGAGANRALRSRTSASVATLLSPGQPCAARWRRRRARFSKPHHFYWPASLRRASCAIRTPSRISVAAAQPARRRVRFLRPPRRGCSSGRWSLPHASPPRSSSRACSRRESRRFGCAHASNWLGEFATLLPSALLAGAATQVAAAIDPAKLSPLLGAAAGALLGFAAAPCGLGAIAVAGALRAQAPIAAAAFLCVAGIIDLRALVAENALQERPRCVGLHTPDRRICNRRATPRRCARQSRDRAPSGGVRRRGADLRDCISARAERGAAMGAGLDVGRRGRRRPAAAVSRDRNDANGSLCRRAFDVYRSAYARRGGKRVGALRDNLLSRRCRAGGRSPRARAALRGGQLVAR